MNMLDLPPELLTGSRQFDVAAAAQMERLIVDLGALYEERNRALREATRAHHETLLRLSMAAELKDEDTGVHIVRMGLLAEALALRLGQAPRYAELIRHAAPMHDIGKIGIPDAVLKKPGALTPEERATMNQHPTIGARILGRSRVPLLQLGAEIAQTHHERFDGSGYPAGLKGEAIPLSGRIVAVVDVFDALTMDRCYRPAIADDLALDMLRSDRGKAFDPGIVDTFVAHAGAMIALRNDINSRQLSFADLGNFGDLE